MKRIWAFLNAPVIVVTEAAILLGILGFSGFRQVSKAFDTDDTRTHRIEALSKIELVSFSEVVTGAGQAQKFIGTIRNHSSYILKGLTGSVCFYSEDGRLTDVFTEPLDGIGTLGPNGSREFSISLGGDRDASSDGPKAAGVKVEVKIVDVVIDNK